MSTVPDTRTWVDWRVTGVSRGTKRPSGRSETTGSLASDTSSAVTSASGVPGATSTKRQFVSGRSSATADAKPANPLAAGSSAALRATNVSGGADDGRRWI
jgi:hypothetical protein